MNIAVIGTGISGLSISQMLTKKHTVTLFESKPDIGGLIKCERVQDCLFHKVGGHVFNAKNQEVLDWFWSFFDRDKEFVKATRNAKVFFNGSIIGYPIENNIYNLPSVLLKKIVKELLILQKESKKPALHYDNFELFLRESFGDTLFNIYFEPYNKKIWQTDLKQVAMEWLLGKLPMPDYADIILNNIMKNDESEMVHATFYYPLNEGSQFIINRLSEGLTIIKNYHVSKISNQGGKVIVNDDKIFDKLIYTGDVRTLPINIQEILLENNIDTNYLNNLKSNGTSNLFCETDPCDISWLYIPENFTKAHRIIYTGNFSRTNSKGSTRQTCVVEFSGKVAYEIMIKEIKKLPGNLKPITSNYESNSYVIQDKNTRPTIIAVKKLLKKRNIFLLGRFAEWEYYNMDKAIEAGLKLTKELTTTNN